MATNNEIAAFENFRFKIGDEVRLRARVTGGDRKIIVTFNPDTSTYETDNTSMEQEAFIHGIVISRLLIQGNSGGVARCYYVKGPQVNNQTTFESELEHVPRK